MAFKCISGHAAKYLMSQFITREHVTKRTTTCGQKLHIPLFKTTSGQNYWSLEQFKLLTPHGTRTFQSISSRLLKRADQVISILALAIVDVVAFR